MRCGATTVNKAAMFLAQLGHESGGGVWREEIASGEAYNGRVDLGNTQPGDGPRYKGHSFIQITGRANHRNLSRWAFDQGIVPTPTYFEDDPEALTRNEYVWIGAIWYLTEARPGFMDAAERGDLEACTRMVNGGLNGLDDRRAYWDRARALGDRILPALTTGGDDDFMSALTDDEQREVLSLLRVLAKNPYPSRSPLRHLGEGPIDTVAGIGLNEDGNVHVMAVIECARVGDYRSLALLAEVAGADPVKYPDRQQDALLARRILADLEANYPAALQAFVNSRNGASA